MNAVALTNGTRPGVHAAADYSIHVHHDGACRSDDQCGRGWGNVWAGPNAGLHYQPSIRARISLPSAAHGGDLGADAGG